MSSRSAHQKVEQVIAKLVVPGIVIHGLPRAIARKRVAQHLGDLRPRRVAHQENPVREENRLVHVVGDQEDRLLGGGPDLQQLVLDEASSERVERSEERGFRSSGQRR